MVKIGLKILAVIVVILLAVYIRVFIYQIGEFKKAEKAYNEKNYKDAITYYDTTLHMYTPFSPYINKSIGRMIEIANQFEKENNYNWALNTYENLRSAIYSTQSFYLPNRDIVELCDKKIAELLTKIPK
ncbi:MAG: hypothetical protein N2999_03875 [Proteobacteria bacterium]|nr:hypothetical protein [Pseudomonadota bacterium]